jgi:hypothetical protein
MPMQRRTPFDRLSETILADRKWFRDGEPNWIEGKNKPWERPCRTAAAAHQLRCDEVRLIRRHGKDLPAAEQGRRVISLVNVSLWMTMSIRVACCPTEC